MTTYFRPLAQYDPARPLGAQPLAGGPGWFAAAERRQRGGDPGIVAAPEVPQAMAARLAAPRAPLAGLAWNAPRIMGIVNVTPDSFSDGGRAGAGAVAHGLGLAQAGADMLDVGGESTRPGAAPVSEAEEIARVVPVIEGLRAGCALPISIDTRKAGVARAAMAAGATLVNDVSGLTYDPALAPLCAANGWPVIIMHAQGTPETMQHAPRYDDVLLDVFDWLGARLDALEAIGLPRDRVMIDPGIGFGKTLAHNLALLRGLSLFHGLGCPILLGASRKRFIGTLTGEDDAARRGPGSVGVALAAVAQGVQMVRVHDVADTRAALTMWQAIHEGEGHGT